MSQQTDVSDYPTWFQEKRTAQPLIVARWVSIALVGLLVVALLAIVICPTIWMFYHSLRDTNIQSLFLGSHEYIGFENYVSVLGSDRFQQSLGHLVQYLTFGACLQVVIGTVLALTLYEFVKSNEAILPDSHGKFRTSQTGLNHCLPTQMVLIEISH